ncbi:MAG TPA: heavy metal translocating P-type ATPase [Steroidobacteraceae bacterium]|nr:heavy metal translocating P-type ATPase [Steroidobacteraceae bacterium]
MPREELICFHCAEPLGQRAPLWIQVLGSDRPVCCPGCHAAAALIGTLELEDFYRFRTAPAVVPVSRRDPRPQSFAAYDEPALLEALSQPLEHGRVIDLSIEGLTCAACSWLITRSLERIPGILEVSVNSATARARVAWDPGRVRMSRLLERIETLGYRPQIISARSGHEGGERERRALLTRLAVSGLGMMQVMMFAVALYAGRAQGMDAEVREYLTLVSLLVATPVMLYGGWPYFTHAMRALGARAITMDVPVSLALILAYGASVFNAWRGRGEVYFDSITMFIFFLTVARYVEMIARHRSTDVSDTLGRMLPIIAHRMDRAAAGSAAVDVPLALLKSGDTVQVRAGEIVPADGVLALGEGEFDESMLTGESMPIAKRIGDRISAGTLNAGSPVLLTVTATGPATVLASIVALLSRAHGERPRLTRAADHMASRFLACVLLIACGVAAVWGYVDPGRAFAATLAVLVVACPCAFSLATLVAVASAQAALARRGVLITHPDALERLAQVTRVVFDKTGTLTRGSLRVTRTRAYAELSEDRCRAIAAALEAGSEHPIARAFLTDASATSLRAEQLEVVPGGGVAATIGPQRYLLGQRSFVLRVGDLTAGTSADDGALLLASEDAASGLRRVLASFVVEDVLRPESPAVVAELAAHGLGSEILSGDAERTVRRVARDCAIASAASRQSPAQKLEHVKGLARAGEFIAMVGDGINDAPVLGGAGVSVAMSRGSALALASADLILVADSLEALPAAFTVARRTLRIVRQNLIWAGGYNILCMPLAALGWIPPWLAALGMSSSSILVVLNALRLMRTPRPSARAPRNCAPGARLDTALDASHPLRPETR